MVYRLIFDLQNVMKPQKAATFIDKTTSSMAMSIKGSNMKIAASLRLYE